MMHRYHPDPEKNDPPIALLFDDCQRCAQQATDPRYLDPRYLDDNKLSAAYARVQDDNWSGTGNERKLYEFMYKLWCISQRLDRIGAL